MFRTAKRVARSEYFWGAKLKTEWFRAEGAKKRRPRKWKTGINFWKFLFTGKEVPTIWGNQVELISQVFTKKAFRIGW